MVKKSVRVVLIVLGVFLVAFLLIGTPFIFRSLGMDWSSSLALPIVTGAFVAVGVLVWLVEWALT